MEHLPGGDGQFLPERAIVDCAQQGLGEPVYVPRLDEEGIFFVGHHFRHPAHRGGDDDQAGIHGFEQNVRRTLAVRRQDEHVGQGIERADGFLVAKKQDGLAETEPAAQNFQGRNCGPSPAMSSFSGRLGSRRRTSAKARRRSE